jgi:cbb3-type cytochrome oxidase maturation protein
MAILMILVPAALLLGLLGLAAFFWSVRTKQYDDPEGAARRILNDEEEPR